jgi:hypothetical protein
MLTKDETVNIAASHAEEEFLCSEAVLITLAECLGVESKLIPRIATGFGAGVGREGEVCGALSGAVMGLGLKFGREVSPVSPWTAGGPTGTPQSSRKASGDSTATSAAGTSWAWT